MNNQTINGKQIKYVIALFLIGSALVSGTSANANQDSWITIIIAAGAAMLMALAVTAILRLYPGENLYQIIINIFGKIAGKIICAIYVFYSIHLGALVLNIFAEFIHIVNMDETPKILIGWYMIIPSVLIVIKGLGVLGRTAKFIYPLLCAMVLFTIVLSIKDMHFDNILPVFGTDMKKLLDCSFTIFALPFGEIVVPATLFSIDPKENYRKIYISGIFLGFIVLFSANLRNLFTLGALNMKIFPFSSYQSVSIIAVGEFLTRMEVIIGINLMLAGFFKMAVCCFSSAIGLAKIFNVSEYRYFSTAGPMIIITLISFLFKNIVETHKYIEMYKYYVIPYQIILPFIILIAGYIKKKLKNTQIAKEAPQQNG